MSRDAERDGDDVDVMRTVGSKYSVEILGATHESRSAQELSDRLDIPIATCYRRLDDLVTAGLLSLEERYAMEESRQQNVYRRAIDEVTVRFGEGGFGVRVDRRAQVKNKISDAWHAMSDS